MKILMLTPYLPYPLLSGGQTRTYNLLKKLAKKHQITLFSFIRKDEERNYVPELNKLGVRVEVVKRRPAWQISNILLAGSTLYPFLVSIYISKDLKTRLTHELEENKYDVVHAEPFYVVPNLPKLKVPLLLVDQTIEFEVYQHFVKTFKYFFLKPLMYLDVAKLKYWEVGYWKKADRVVAMSEDDKNTMQKLVPNLRVDIVPNGVDGEHFDKTKSEVKKFLPKNDNPVILYVGSCTWLQNREAIEVLYKKVWPKILERLPSAKLWIIGKAADNFFGNWRADNVRVDEVEDIREAYFGAKVMVAPIYGAGGTRYKNFEAFASGIPVVTTSIGIGGTEAENGKNVIIRDTTDQLAEAAVELIKDKKLYKQISDNAKKLVHDKYDWDSISERLSKIYEELGQKT